MFFKVYTFELRICKDLVKSKNYIGATNVFQGQFVWHEIITIVIPKFFLEMEICTTIVIIELITKI